MTEPQAVQMITLLTEIRDLLAWRDEPAREVDDAGNCLHPEELRVQMGREWICRRCRFQSQE